MSKLLIMNFFYKKEECRSLSNFWECEVRIVDEDGNVRTYDSGECCFHGEKFTRVGRLCEDTNRKKELLEYGNRFLKGNCEKDGSIAKKMGRKFILNKEELDIWYNLGVEVQREICKYKFANYEEVRNDLRKNMGKVLIHPAMRCSEEKVRSRLWEGKGIVVDGKIEVIGKNMLGKLWMELQNQAESL